MHIQSTDLLQIILRLFPKPPEADSITGINLHPRHGLECEVPEAAGCNHHTQDPKQVIQDVPSHVPSLGRHYFTSTETSHASMNLGTMLDHVLAGEREWIDEEHSHQQHTQEVL